MVIKTLNLSKISVICVQKFTFETSSLRLKSFDTTTSYYTDIKLGKYNLSFCEYKFYKESTVNFLPQSFNSKRTPSSALPFSVSEYSTFGGTSA